MSDRPLKSKVDLSRLTKCKLWPGSQEETTAKYSMLTSEWLERRLEALRRCDDRTEGEQEYLEALEATLEEHWGFKP